MITKTVNLRRQLGIVNGILYSINRGLEHCPFPFKVVKYYFLAQKITDQPLLSRARGRSLNIVEIPRNYDHNPCPRPPFVIRNRYNQGAVCMAAYKAEDFAGCLWFVKNKYIEDEVNCIFELSSNDSVWDFDVYVVPKYRLTPVFLKLWDYTSERLLKEGCCWSISRVSAFNANSLSSHKRMGAEEIGWALFVCMGTLQLTVSNIAPFFHFSFGKASFPTFRLKPPK